MSDKKPNIYAHGCYIGTTGFNNHTRDFFRELSNQYKIKLRNYTVPISWDGVKDEPFNNENYLLPLDKKLLINQTVYNDESNRYDIPIYTKHSSGEFNYDINLVLAEVNHHYFYDTYEGPKIAYTVWETTRYPTHFNNRLKEYDQIWVPTQWQKDCNIEQGIPESKIKVIPEAVDGSTFKPNSKVTLPEYKDGRFKFVCFGRWDYRKSTKEVIESFLNEFDKDEPVDLILSIDNYFVLRSF